MTEAKNELDRMVSGFFLRMNYRHFLLLCRHVRWCHARLCYAAFSLQLVQVLEEDIYIYIYVLYIYIYICIPLRSRHACRHKSKKRRIFYAL